MCKLPLIESGRTGTVRLIKTWKIHLVLEIWRVLTTVFDATTMPIRSALTEATATLIHMAVIPAAAFRSKSAATATIWAASSTATATCGFIGKVNLDWQNVPGFNTVTLFLLTHQVNRLIVLMRTDVAITSLQLL